MGWEDYTNTLKKDGNVTNVLLCGHDGTVWCTTGNFIEAKEIKAYVGGFKDPNSLRSVSPTCGGKKTVIIQATDRSIYGKGPEDAGVCIVKTVQAVFIAWYEKPIKGPQCNTAVEKMADYLIEMGY
jgi:profilin